MRLAFLPLTCLALGACGTLRVPDDRPQVGVNYQFERRHACGDGPYKMAMARLSRSSPRLELTQLPPQTRVVKVEMVDLDLLSFDHGGGEATVAQGGSATLPEGALKAWSGPCPPTGADHRYEMRVEARDAQGKSLASGKQVRTCCKQFEAR
ncbi:hypothetical protein AAW51_4379 [Caldimonas brevitalea]|uniref:Lipoprotein n=2 Tax=Caldimonas brevitalea TaxID=413882 RepID=A0A0G3BX05_9BURK|nr:hypothetical protein AAW51_4379 [Caldimonas brevitalea]